MTCTPVVYGFSVIQAQLISANVESYSTAINSELHSQDLPYMSLQVPPELFAGSDSGDGEEVRVLSVLYYNVENVFPSGRPGTNG